MCIPCKLTICVFSVIILSNSFVVYSAFTPSHLNMGKKLKRETKYNPLPLFKTDSQTVGTVTRCPSLREALLSIVMENIKNYRYQPVVPIPGSCPFFVSFVVRKRSDVCLFVGINMSIHKGTENGHTAELDKDQSLLWLVLHWRWSCHNNIMMSLFVLLAGALELWVS